MAHRHLMFEGDLRASIFHMQLIKINTDAMSRTIQLVQDGFVKITE